MANENPPEIKKRNVGRHAVITGCWSAVAGAILLPIVAITAFVIFATDDDIGGPLFWPIVLFFVMLVDAVAGGVLGLLGGFLGAIITGKRHDKRSSS